MAWTRRGSRDYFYQSVRHQGRPTRVYLGFGPEADLAAAEIAARRQQRRDQAEALQREEKSHGDA